MGANVHWVGHPNWFFRLSKYTLPFLKSQYVPDSIFLNEADKIPADLENYVLKPLYSFAGSGVIINLNRFDIEAIPDPENYILQKKVVYAPVIETPNVGSKCEIRVMFLWDNPNERPLLVNNLVRLSKGEMVGVKYNKDKDWVGGSVGFFEQEG
jgi:glutathionylspermidine synthase